MVYSVPFKGYDSLGVRVPQGYEVLGIDVSHHQREINWQQVSAMRDVGLKMHFAFMKATQGTYLSDPNFKQNWQEARANYLVRGAYLFFDPRQNGQQQAGLFIKTVSLQSGDLPPVIDFEELYGVQQDVAIRRLHECARALAQHYNVKPIIYTYADFYQQHLSEVCESFPLWVAHYRGWGGPRVARNWHFWQFSDEAQVDGIGSRVDCNVFNGTREELLELTLD